MNNDILPPQKDQTPTDRPQPELTPADSSQPVPMPQPAVAEAEQKDETSWQADQQQAPAKKSSPKKLSLIILAGLIAVVLAALVAGFIWYQQSLRPLSDYENAALIAVDIEAGSTPSEIAAKLADKDVIRNQLAFEIYTRVSRTQHKLQAGSYRLSPAQSTPQIVEHLLSGKVDEITITFFPGATLTDNTDKDKRKKVDVTTVLLRAGYSQEEISTALAKDYQHPVFATKPDSADLEGYVFGETYRFSASASVEDILTRTFDELYKNIQKYDLIEKYKQQGLSLYEGITLASIIQREVSGAEDQKQVAQIFYKRLSDDMPLGADATFVYGAAKLGVPPAIDLDSPYNTRKHPGLPPGPISAPGLSALRAAGSPADGDYLYFVSGDDGTNYFSRSLEEHEANTRKYCKLNCSLF